MRAVRVRRVLAVSLLMALATPGIVLAGPAQAAPSPSRSAFTTIQAEDHNAMAGIQLEPTQDTGGGQNVGWAANGDWIAFDGVDFSTGAAGVTARVASAAGISGEIEIRLDALSSAPVARIPVSSTGGWQSWVTRSAAMTATTGVHRVFVRFASAQAGDVVNLNWLSFTRGATAPGRDAYRTIQAESFVAQQGVLTEPSGDTDGSPTLSYVARGDWTRYGLVDFGSVGAGRLDVRVASGAAPGVTGTVSVRLGSVTGTEIARVPVSPTGGWQSWRTLSTAVGGTTGTHDLYVRFDSAQAADFTNLNWLAFVPRSTTPPPASNPITGPALFDDFSYTSSSDARLAQRGWTVRTGGGGPGVGAPVWDPAQVTFPAVAGGRAMQLEAWTNGSAARTTEVYHQRKFFEGTYAARVHFTDAPTFGPDGDQVNQTFFTITPLAYANDPQYGEIDFEYLSNGGWGQSGPSMFETTWETYQPDPWVAQNEHSVQARSYAGWHDLVMQVSGGRVTFFIDGTRVAEHGGANYPETPMSINMNHWFIALTGGSAERSYAMQVDYVLHAKNQVLSPAQVDQAVSAYRTAGVAHTDTV